MSHDNKFAQPPTRQQIRGARDEKRGVEPRKTIAQWDEFEIAERGLIVPTRVLLLTGSECRFTCTMCDLWRHTLDRATAPGDLLVQINDSLQLPWSLPSPTNGAFVDLKTHWIKLYNSSNFFDPYNVPTQDLIPIAKRLPDFAKVIVENHPRLMSENILSFRDALEGRLEIAMGLETTDPVMLKWLNKGMTLDDFQKAMNQLRSWQIKARVFLLLGLPGMSFSESLQSCLQSIAIAVDAGVRHCSVIPTRSQHGLLAQLSDKNRTPKITAHDLEHALSNLVGRWSCIVTVDLWDWDQLPGHCEICRYPRRQRLEAMSILQQPLPFPTIRCSCLTIQNASG